MNRLVAHIRIGFADGCWRWAGHKTADGYGLLGGPSTTLYQRGRAHRIAYETFVGPIPPGMMVLHRCDRRECTNPEHLRLGTFQENMDDMWAKGRARPRGKAQPPRTL